MYWKIVSDGVVKSIGYSSPPSGIEITSEEFNEILNTIRSLEAIPGYTYELLTDLTWRITPPLGEEEVVEDDE